MIFHKKKFLEHSTSFKIDIQVSTCNTCILYQMLSIFKIKNKNKIEKMKYHIFVSNIIVYTTYYNTINLIQFSFHRIKKKKIYKNNSTIFYDILFSILFFEIDYYWKKIQSLIIIEDQTNFQSKKFLSILFEKETNYELNLKTLRNLYYFQKYKL